MLSADIELRFYIRKFLLFAAKAKKEERQPFQATAFWWRRVDSNHRSETQQIYSLPPLATRELLHIQFSSVE